MPEANAAERKRWNDDNWVKVWPKREALTDEITPYLLEALALQPGERVLDVGCGGGKATIAAAHAVGAQGHATGADISVPLLELARQRAADAHAANATFIVADMQLDAIEGAPLDVVMSQFGVMFFDESVKAFTNIRAHLAPGGRIAFACWQTMDRNPWFFGAALGAILGPPPAPDPGKNPTGPFALGDPDYTRGILEAAGFTDVRRAAHDLLPEIPDDAIVDDAQLTFLGVPPEKLADASAAVASHLAQFRSGPGLSKVPLAFQIFQATAH